MAPARRHDQERLHGDPTTTVKESADLMAERGFIALPVVDADGELIGMVTQADLVWHRPPRSRYRGTDEADAARSEGPVDEPATPGRGVTTSPAIAMGAGSDVVDLVAAIAAGCARSMPIVDGNG
jgi:CBS-domain-containing membrane protein